MTIPTANNFVTYNKNYMSKSKWGTPAYLGKPSPFKAANRFMQVLVFVLLVGFIKAGLREDWFEPIINFIMY